MKTRNALLAFVFVGVWIGTCHYNVLATEDDDPDFGGVKLRQLIDYARNEGIFQDSDETLKKIPPDAVPALTALLRTRSTKSDLPRRGR